MTTPSPANKLMHPGKKYWFWSGDGLLNPSIAQLLTLDLILPDTHSRKYRTKSGRFDYASFKKPTSHKMYKVILIKTVTYDEQGNEIELDEPILKLDANVYAVNGLHLWDRLWLNFTAAVKSADTIDTGILFEKPFTGYNPETVPTTGEL